MIKGTSKRVIVVKHPDTELFEEAYFIVKETRRAGKNDTKSLVAEAKRIINREKEGEKKNVAEVVKSRLVNVFFFLLGNLFSFLVFYMLINA